MADRQGHARIDPPSVDQDRAGAAMAAVASFLGTRQVEPLTQQIEQCHAGVVQFDVPPHTVNGEADGEIHVSSNQCYDQNWIGADRSAALSKSVVRRHMRRHPPFSRGRRKNDRCWGRGFRKRSFSINGMRDNAVPRKRFVIKTAGMAERVTDTVRRPRADAVRNRERVLSAAKVVFSAGGPEASLEAVAKRAGVGIGTLYRHFPTRQDLFEAVYRREVRQLVELAEELKNEAAPVDALRRWLRSNVELVATKKGMIAALALAVQGSSELYAYSFDRLTKAVGTLLHRAVAAGEIRADVSAEDLLRALIGMCYLHDQPGWQSTVLRLMDVFIDGLRVKPDGGGKTTSSSQRGGVKKRAKPARKR